jgi:hypothetical protein
MSKALFSRIAGTAQRMEADASRTLVLHGINPTSVHLPATEPTQSFALVLPPPIHDEIVALGYPTVLAHQLSDSYLSSAQSASERCTTEYPSARPCLHMLYPP